MARRSEGLKLVRRELPLTDTARAALDSVCPTARYMRPLKDAAAEVLRAAVIHNLSPDSGAILVEETEAPDPTDPIPPDEILNDYFPVRGGGLEPPWLLTASTSIQ